MSAFNISTEKTDQNASESDNAGQTPLLGTLHLNGFVEPSTALPESASPALSVSSAASSRRNSGIFGLLFSTPTPSPTPLRHQETALQVVEASDHVELGSIDSPHPNPPSVNFEPPALLDSAPTTPVLELAGSSHGSPGSPAAKSRLPMPISVSTMGPPPASRLKGRTRANSGAPQPSRLRTPSNLRDSLLESIEESMTTFEEAVAKVNSDSQKEKESVEGSAPLTPSSETSTSSATPLVPSSTSTAETQRARSGPVATPPQPWRFPWQTPPQPAKQTDGKIQPDAHIRPSAIPIPAGKTPTMSLVGSAPNTAASSPLTQTRARSSSTASQGFRFPWQSAPQETKEIEAREDTTTQSQTDSRPSSQHEASPANPLAFLFNSFDPKNNENHNREEIASNAGSRPSSRPSSVVSTPEMPVRKSNRPHTPFDFLFDIPVMPSSEKMKQKTLEVKAADAMSTAPSTPTVEHSRDFGDETITSDSQIPSVVVQPAESKLDGTTDVNETRISPSLQPESSKSSDGNDNTAVMARMPSNASNVSMSRQSSMPNMLRRSSSASSFSSPASPFWFNFAKPAGMERSLSAPGSPISVRNSIYYSEGDRSSRICDDDDLVMHDVDADSQGSLGSPRAVDAEVNEQSRADDDRETHTSSPWSNVASFEPLDVNEVISTWRPTALEPIGEEQELSETEEASPTTMGVDEKVLKRNETLFRNGPVAVAPGTLLQNKLANALASRGGGALEAVLPRLKFRTTSRPEPPTPDAEDKVLSAGEVPKRFGEVLVSPVSVQMMHDRAWADGHILKNADETGALSPILEEHDGPMEARIEEESPLPDYGFEDTDNGALAALNQPVCRPDQIDLAAELQALQKSNERLQEQNQRLMYELSIATPLDDGPSDLSYSQNPSPEPTASGAATPMSSASPSPTPSFHRRSFIPLSHRRSLRHLRPASSMSTTSTSSSGTLPEASMHFSGSDDNVESLRAHIAELQNRLAELVGQQGDTPYLLEKDLNLFGSPAIHKHVDVADIALSPIMEVRQLLLTNDVGIHPFYDVQSKEDQAMNNVNAPIQLQSHDVEVQLDICGTFVDAETSTDLPELQDIFVQTTDTNFTSSEAQVKLTSLVDENGRLKDALQQLETEAAKRDQIVATLESSVLAAEKLGDDLSTVLDDNQRLKLAVAALEQEVIRKTGQAAGLEAQIRASEKRSEETINRLTDENTSLKSKAETLQRDVKKNADRVASLEINCLVAVKNGEELMEEKTRLKKALNALEYEVSRSSDEVISHQKELAASKESIKDLKRSTDEALKLQRETFSENERLTSAVKSRDETIGDLKTTIDGHVNNEKCLREEVDRLMTLWKLSQSDATAKSQQLADFKSKLDIAEKQIIELSAAQDLANQTREQVDSLKVTMEEAEKVAEAALLSTYEAWNEERTSLKKQMEESQAQREREMREAVNEMRKVNEDIRCKLEIKESANTQLATTVKRLEDEVQSERRNSTDRVRRLEAEVENERRRSMDVVRRMEEQIEGERRKSNDLRRGLEEQIATERRNSGEVTRRMEVVEKEKKGFGVNLARVAELQAALLAKGTELQKLSAHIDELEESKKLAAVQVDRELNELRSQLQARTEEIEYLKKEVESKSSVIEITEGKLRALAQDLGNALQDRDSRDRRILELEAEVLRYTLEMEELQKMVLDLSMEKEVEPEEANIPSATELTPGQRAVIERLLLAEELKGTVEYLTLQNVGLQEALERLESELEIQKSTSILEVTQDSQIQHAEGASPVGGEMVMYCDGQCCSAARQLLQTHAHLDSLKMVVKDLELMAEQREHRIRQLENLAGQHSPSLPRSRSIRAKSLALGSKGPTVLSTVDEDPQAEADEERESEVTQLKQDLDAARSAIKIYETQVAELKQTLDDVERARHVPVDTIKLLHRVRTLEDWIHQKVDELAELEFELGRTRATANSLEEELEKERGDHAALRKQMDRLKRAAASAAGSQARRLRHVSTATGTSSSGVSTAVLQRKGSFSTSLLGDILPSVLFDELSDLNGAVVRYNVGKPESSSGSSDLGMHANGVSLTANDTANRNTAEVDMADDGEKNLPNYNLADLERVVAESRKRIMDLERELSELDSTNSLLRRDKMALRQLVADLEAEQRKKKQNGTKRLLMWPLRRDRETHSQAALDHS